jgi:hypothetical protein
MIDLPLLCPVDPIDVANPDYAVRPDGAFHQWKEVPPRELSIALVADERFSRVTG